MRSINYFIILVLLVTSCKKDPIVPVLPDGMKNGMLVLCEGLFQHNNASVSWVDFSTAESYNQFFLNKTGRELGDTGNDMLRYGAKIYIVTSVSSTLEILRASDFASLKQVNMMNGSQSKQPRSIAGYGSKVYITCFDGYVDVLDTLSMQLVSRIQVGANPEGLTVANGKLYVANSGGLSYPDMDSTLSVIDLSSGIELSKITVGLNPGAVIADAQGDVYVICRGNYGTVPFKLVRVNSQTDQVDQIISQQFSSFAKMGDKLLLGWQDPSSSGNAVALFDPLSETILNPNYLNTDEVQTLYGIAYNSITNQIYISDAGNYTSSGFIRVYKTDGSLVQSYQVGLIPSKIVFYE